MSVSVNTSGNSLLSNISKDSSGTIKIIESCNYTISDFEHYNIKVLDNICKNLKVPINNKNRLSVFKKCKKELSNVSSRYTCDTEVHKWKIIEPTPNFTDDISNLVDSYSVSVIYDEPRILKSIESSNCYDIQDLSGVFDDTRSILHTPCAPVDTKMSMGSSMMTFNNVKWTSTPEKKQGDLTVSGIKTSKYKRVESPLKSAFFKRTPVKSGTILPLGTKNKYDVDISCLRKNNQKNFGGCDINEGQFSFTKEEWSYIVKENQEGYIRMVEAKYPTMFRKRFKTVNNTCVVNFKSVNYPKTVNHYLVYAYCSHQGCKSFKLKVSPRESKTVVSVYSSSLDYYHNTDYSLTNHVRGIERDLIRETLKDKCAFRYNHETVKCASPSKLRCGNLQNIKSHDVVRKARSEALAEYDYDREDLNDLIGMFYNENYVKLVGLPAYVHWYCDEQLDLLTTLKSRGKGPVTGYLDATGTVVRKINSDDKRVLYYAIVVSASLLDGSSVTCPIVEMVSSSHDIITISQWLTAFKAFVLKNKREWPVFKNIVTDFSYAQMHSVCIGWNGFSSIFDYLNWCYSVLYEVRDGMTITVINVCANHYTKIIVNHVHTHFSKTSDAKSLKRVQNSIIDWICLIFNMDNMADIEEWFKLFTIILSSRTKTDKVNNALSIFKNKCIILGNVEYDESCLEGMTNDLPETQTSKSKMYFRFQTIKNSVNTDSSFDLINASEDNEYFNEDYLEQFTLKCVPFIPLWTPVMNKKLNTGVEVRQSNATIESWFKTVKHDLNRADSRFKCGRFIRNMHDRVMNVCKQVEYNIRKKLCTRKLKFDKVSPQQTKLHTSGIAVSNKCNGVDETYLDSIEEWGKKEKQLKHLQPIGFRPFKMFKLKIPIPVIDSCSKRVISEGSVTLKEPLENCVENIVEESVQVFEINKNIMNHSSQSMDCHIKSLSTAAGSYTSPFRREMCDIELYENMLPKDLDYYRLMKIPRGKYSEFYIVGKYSCVSSNGKNNEFVLPELDIRDFDKLSGNNWLNNFVIDVCLKLKALELNLQNVEVMSCNEVRSLLDAKDAGDNRMQKIYIKENSTVYMPWNVNGNHWIIAIVDFKTKNCFIMDPQNPVEENRTSALRFKSLCKSLISKCSYGECNDFPTLSLSPCPMKNIPTQIDGYNCGVFIIYYAFTIMAKSSFDLDFNPIEYRIYLKKYLLQNSEDMTNICLFCGRCSNKHRVQGDESVVNWVSCSRCCRWVSVNCMPNKYKSKDYEDCDFKCPLCAPREWAD